MAAALSRTPGLNRSVKMVIEGCGDKEIRGRLLGVLWTSTLQKRVIRTSEATRREEGNSELPPHLNLHSSSPGLSEAFRSP
jgi:hypothetical protein